MVREMNISDFKDLLKKIEELETPSQKDLEEILKIEDNILLKVLFDYADNIRKKFCGDGVFLRGIIEFSNYCVKDCFYCGLNKNNTSLKRYRLTKEEILESVEKIVRNNIKTVVLQSGEDLGIDVFWLADLISEIKKRFDIAITLSCGERDFKDYKILKEAGADRYLLKIETSDKKLYESMHKNANFKKRLECLDNLKILGYQVGSGNIIGLPSQDISTIAKDIIFFKEKDFDMIGIGPFIPHPNSVFKKEKQGSIALTLKTIALTRIVTKNAHIPATTALGSLEKDYRIDGLRCGANVLMPQFTPEKYRKFYQIYPNRRCVNEAVGKCVFCLDSMVKTIGRFIDFKRGDTLKLNSLNV